MRWHLAFHPPRPVESIGARDPEPDKTSYVSREPAESTHDFMGDSLEIEILSCERGVACVTIDETRTALVHAAVRVRTHG